MRNTFEIDVTFRRLNTAWGKCYISKKGDTIHSVGDTIAGRENSLP